MKPTTSALDVDRYDPSESDDRRVADVIGTAMFLCPPEWASSPERDRSARAVAEFAEQDEELVARSCRAARYRFAAGRIRRDVVRLLEGVLELVAPTREGGARRAHGRVPAGRAPERPVGGVAGVLRIHGARPASSGEVRQIGSDV